MEAKCRATEWRTHRVENGIVIYCFILGTRNEIEGSTLNYLLLTIFHFGTTEDCRPKYSLFVFTCVSKPADSLLFNMYTKAKKEQLVNFIELKVNHRLLDSIKYITSSCKLSPMLKSEDK